MFGLTSCFVAGLASAIVGQDADEAFSEELPSGIRYGMVAARKYFVEGFGREPENGVFPNPAIFERSPDDVLLLEHVQDVKIHQIKSQQCQNCWFILKEKSTANLAEIAIDVVRNGTEKALRFIPTAKFGSLKTIDRTEIESYRSIRNLIAEYIAAGDTTRPLSIAVFGTPGSGKSYGVSEVAASVAPNRIKKISYNLSQFGSAAELTRAFYKIRDFAVDGTIPLIIFDEFDSAFESKLGWLKYFLAPMQDGVFRDMETTHPIGKAIFVFTGGTSSSFTEFCGEDIRDEQELRQFTMEFRNAKGPDFISRLRGYVNILGPNQSAFNDHLFIIRRAMLLRALIERKLPQLINENGEAQIDMGVLRAMLKIPRYKHEARSMEAIMDMSMLSNTKKWEQSLLPCREQLRLHVDDEQFLRLMMHDAFFSEKIEFMAQLLREKHTGLPDCIALDGDNGAAPWKTLPENIKETYRKQIRQIPEALPIIHYDVVHTDGKPGPQAFSAFDTEELAGYILEYDQKYGHFELDDGKEFVFQTIPLWIEVLSEAGFKLERLSSVNLCEL